MRAAVLTTPGRLAVVDDWPDPVCRPDHVIVAIRDVGICGTDLGLFDGSRTVPHLPWVIGHEAHGRIVEVGAGIPPSRIGERVAIEPNYPCQACAPCQNGAPALCLRRGSPALNLPGMLAERVEVPARHAWTLPAGLADQDAVCVEPLAVALAAVRRAALTGTASCLVVGAGALGLLLVHALRSAGHPVAVLEPHPERRARAVALGAAHAPDGTEFPVAFETSGTAAGGEAALARLAPQGRLVLVGVGSDPIPLDTRIAVRRGLTVLGSMIYDHPRDYRATIDAVARDSITPGIVVAASYPLEQAQEAFTAASSVPGKTVITLAEGGAA
ncbi:zinc-dependent alcohol dehydrogenase [Microtetraspora glauca]|uniref:Alcohol dehydrogenase catalytic domain-containing protein n=1 Tax=Microtetraspora glauca TaxID=1996 RepID=A0ABV3GK42_MICGL